MNFRERIRGMRTYTEQLTIAQRVTENHTGRPRLRVESPTQNVLSSPQEIQTKAKTENLLNLLVELGAKTKLEEISQELWQCGQVTQGCTFSTDNFDKGEAYLALVFPYESLVHIPMRIRGDDKRVWTTAGTRESSIYCDQNGTKWEDEHQEVGTKTTSLRVAGIYRSFRDKIEFNIYDSEMFRLFNLDSDLDNKVAISEFLERGLLESCRFRVIEGKLPFQLQAAEKWWINREIPWYRRIFR